MRKKVYQTLVNRHSGISKRYHSIHDGASGIKKIWSWIYLLILNFAYYFLLMHFLEFPPKNEFYEVKNLNINQSESNESKITLDSKIEELINNYDIVSFDVFDTLIFRPFSEPTDLFYLIGNELKYMDFKRIRTQMESEARIEKYKKQQTFEVTLQEIWKYIEDHVGLECKIGIETEIKYELKFCHANPYMKDVFSALRKAEKRIIITTDMYLPKDCIQSILEKNGFSGYEKLYLSCNYHKSKADGKLFQQIKEELGQNLRYAHIGDNENSDVRMAKKNGFSPYYYPNINRNSIQYRAYDMSPIIGGAYRGIVNNYLYCGKNKHSMFFEYGFIYGGLFIQGYCNYIHQFCEQHNIDKILFLSRDGEIIKKQYDKIYPGEQTEYVYWSRLAATKLTAKYYQYDFLRRFIDHKVNQGNSLEKIMKSMELEVLLENLPKQLHANDNLTDKNVKEIKAFLIQNWNTILETYEVQRYAAKKWYGKIISDSKRIAIIDIGWAGSGAIALDCLIHNEWKLDCECFGLLAGTNTIHNYEPDATETFFQSGMLHSYLFSFSNNRDLLKLHDPNKGYNIFWELLTSSVQPSFKGFYFDKNQDVKLKFVEPEKNVEGIAEIQEGISKFIDEYLKCFKDYSFMLNISGRDAYAPMIVAASHKEKYLKKIEKEFHLKIGIGD